MWTSGFGLGSSRRQGRCTTKGPRGVIGWSRGCEGVCAEGFQPAAYARVDPTTAAC